MKIRNRVAVIGAVAAIAVLAGCGNGGATVSGGGGGNNLLNQQQAADTQQFAYIEPLPYFPYSQIRQDLIEVEAINALGIASTSFFFEPGISHPVFECPSIGVPMAATDQLSNPTVSQWNVQNSGDQSANAVAGVGVDQMDPDGIFQGDTTGTYNLCVNNAAQQYAGYNEGYTVSVTASAYWDQAAGDGLPGGHIHVIGTPIMPVCKVKVLNSKKHTAEEVCTDPSKPKS